MLGGGNFWMGARQGLIVTAFNFLVHKSEQPQKDSYIMSKLKANSQAKLPTLVGGEMAIITGQYRHIFSPDAVSISLYVQVSSGANVTFYGGGIVNLSEIGDDYSRIYNLELGLGTVNAGVGLIYTEYYCACDSKYVNTNLLMGKGWSTNIQLDDFAKLGFGMAYSTDNKYKFKTYGLSISLGADSVPTGVDLKFNKTMSADRILKLKNILQR